MTVMTVQEACECAEQNGFFALELTGETVKEFL
jgi:hypothetical protein